MSIQDHCTLEEIQKGKNFIKRLESGRMNKKLKELETRVNELQAEIEELKEFDNDDFEVTIEHYIDPWFNTHENQPRAGEKILLSACNNYNTFESQEECQKWAKYINALMKLRLIANHLNQGWVPDWNDGAQEKISLYNEYAKNEITVAGCYLVQSGHPVYFKTKELAEKARDMMGSHLNDLII